ncbi:MAG TPA: hypothetical protein VMH80_09320 [Bryobacteraceae bacterium]|nr:hypothetical protein [Bryobacteraceae bacterium]
MDKCQPPWSPARAAASGVVAISLAEAGFQVFATGRKVETADLPSSVIRIPCDHLDDQTNRGGV